MIAQPRLSTCSAYNKSCLCLQSCSLVVGFLVIGSVFRVSRLDVSHYCGGWESFSIEDPFLGCANDLLANVFLIGSYPTETTDCRRIYPCYRYCFSRRTPQKNETFLVVRVPIFWGTYDMSCPSKYQVAIIIVISFRCLPSSRGRAVCEAQANTRHK